MITGGYPTVKVERAPTGEHILNAWGTSRPNDKTSGLADILKIDVPVNEMEDFILVVKAPIIIREMMFTFRDHVAWARTSRVDDLNVWEVAKGYEEHPEVLLCYEEMQRRMRSETQDNFRDMLPLVYMTEFTLKLSARTLIRIHDAISKLVEELMVHPGPERDPFLAMVASFGIQLKYAIMQTPFHNLPIGVYGYADLFPQIAGRKIGRNEAVRMGDFVSVYLHSIPIVLRAQIVRHRPITFVDSIGQYFNHNGVTAPVASTVSLAMVMPATMAVSMLRKRNCWIAQEDLWLPVIEALNKAFGDDGAFMLPCDGKEYCPVPRDNLLRHEGKDPAPACPLWYAFEERRPNGEQRAAIMGYMEKRTLSKEFWKETYMENIPDEGA